MAKQLTLDELIEAADRARLPTAKPIMRAIESLAMALGADLAERLGVLCGDARFDSIDGLTIAFHARTKRQACPEALCEFDPDEWDEGQQSQATEPGDETSPAAAETMAMFVARYENRHGEAVTRVFATTTLARDWKNAIGRDNWDAVRDGPAPDEIGDAWFEMQADHGSETFSIEPCTLELSLAAPQGGSP
jgi:hypothetical protein